MENILSGTAAFSTRVLVFGTYMHSVTAYCQNQFGLLISVIILDSITATGLILDLLLKML